MLPWISVFRNSWDIFLAQYCLYVTLGEVKIKTYFCCKIPFFIPGLFYIPSAFSFNKRNCKMYLEHYVSICRWQCHGRNELQSHIFTPWTTKSAIREEYSQTVLWKPFRQHSFIILSFCFQYISFQSRFVYFLLQLLHFPLWYYVSINQIQWTICSFLRLW